MMKHEYILLIAEHDKGLSLLREFWITSQNPTEKTRHLGQLNEALDRRLVLMAARDAAA